MKVSKGNTLISNIYGYPGGVHVSNGAQLYGDMFGQIWMMGTQCKGVESSIFECPHVAMVDSPYCSMHDNDVGVRCY